MAPMGKKAAKVMTPILTARPPKHLGASCQPATIAGFTLLEILLVLALIGTASLIVIPNVGSLDSRSFNVEVRQAHTLLNYARRTAVVRGLPSSVTFYTLQDPDETLPPAARTSVGTWQSELTEIRYENSTEQTVDLDESLEIVFYPEGGSTGGRLLFARDEREAAIAVDPFTGRVNIEEEDD